MWALFVILNETHRLPDLVDTLRRLGVDNLTVMHSASYEAALMGKGMPAFSRLNWLPGQQMVHTDTIFALLAGEEHLEVVVRAVEGILDGAGNAGFLFAFPLTLVRGLPVEGDGN